jgi:FAD/FMN-containing dehydrogenase
VARAAIGGSIATNAGGIRVVRYGNTREWIAGLKLVTGNGDLLDLNRGLIKNSSGYDLRHLVIGSEGTLGIVVEATVRLTEPPPLSNVMLLALPSFDGLMQVFAELRVASVCRPSSSSPTSRLASTSVRTARRTRSARCIRIYVVTEFDAASEDQQMRVLARSSRCWKKDSSATA